MTRTSLLAVALGCVLIGPMGKALARDPKSEAASADVNWARGVLDDMFASAFLGETRQVDALASPQLRSTFGTESERTCFGRWLVDRLSREGFNSVDWTDSQLAPDRNEIRFTGILRGKQTRQSGKLTETGFVPEKYEEHKVETSCVVRVARVNGTNQWRVDYVYVKERE